MSHQCSWKYSITAAEAPSVHPTGSHHCTLQTLICALCCSPVAPCFVQARALARKCPLLQLVTTICALLVRILLECLHQPGLGLLPQTCSTQKCLAGSTCCKSGGVCSSCGFLFRYPFGGRAQVGGLGFKTNSTAAADMHLPILLAPHLVRSPPVAPLQRVC